MSKLFWIIFSFFITQIAFATPYWDEHKVPLDSQYKSIAPMRSFKAIPINKEQQEAAVDVLRIQVDWQANGEKYSVNKMVIEPSGTLALLQKSKQKPQWGSYLGILKDKNDKEIYYDAIGTGREYRVLTRAITFRFPLPEEEMTFELYAENPKNGVMEKVVSKNIPAKKDLPRFQPEVVNVRALSLATQAPALRVNIYSEGYLANEEALFWEHAEKAVNALQSQKFPGVEQMSFYGVFHASNKKLDEPENLGYPIPTYDTFLGLYYPYWCDFTRWYNGMYPTNETKVREGFATAPYDYPLVLTNDNGYWGMGNYMVFTAIPVKNSHFTYILLHEFGHFFGLNEEYEGGGPTELEFAPDITEPWSQNITFLVNRNYENLKWKKFVEANMPLPTPSSKWQSNPPVYGAYRGGYGDSASTKGKSHKPGLSCTMDTATHFCEICKNAISEVIQYSLGKNQNKEEVNND